MNAHEFKLKTIDGQEKSLADYKGKVLLIVNVASRCGFTHQYEGLEKLHREMKDKGVVVIGVPCNQFGAQEPGTEEQIKTFCSTKYDVTFDMFSKVDVNGQNAHPLYKWLTTEGKGDVKWNFAKFLVGKDGKLITRFDSKVEPGSSTLRSAIEQAL
jgi:glutathione peroxidase